MNKLTDDVMWDLLFDVLSEHKTGEPITSKLVRSSCNYITKNSKDGMSTDDICDSVLGLFDYYNNYIEERGVNLQPITKDEYDMTVLMLNAAIFIVKEGNNGE